MGMRLVKLVRASYALRDRLRLRYRFLLYGPPILGVAALLPIYWLIIEYIANVVGIGDAPVRGHPMSHWLFLSLAVFGLLTIAIGCTAGGLLLGLWLRYVLGWPWSSVRLLLVESQAPPHWVRPSRDV